MFDVERNTSIGKENIRWLKFVFFKALANRFRLTSYHRKVVHGSTKLFMVDLISNGLHEKVIILY